MNPETSGSSDDDADQKKAKNETQAALLRKRQAKCDRKIAVAIEKLKRSNWQMEFYENFSTSQAKSSSSVQKQLASTILA